MFGETVVPSWMPSKRNHKEANHLEASTLRWTPGCQDHTTPYVGWSRSWLISQAQGWQSQRGLDGRPRQAQVDSDPCQNCSVDVVRNLPPLRGLRVSLNSSSHESLLNGCCKSSKSPKNQGEGGNVCQLTTLTRKMSGTISFI